MRDGRVRIVVGELSTFTIPGRCCPYFFGDKNGERINEQGAARFRTGIKNSEPSDVACQIRSGFSSEKKGGFTDLCHLNLTRVRSLVVAFPKVSR